MHVQKTMPVRFMNGMAGSQISSDSDSGMLSMPAAKAPGWVVRLHRMPSRNMVAMPGVK